MTRKIKTFPKDDGSPKHTMLTRDIEVTMDQHQFYLSSPRMCLNAGIDNYEERTVYINQHEWYGWPPCPDIDPDEETWNE